MNLSHIFSFYLRKTRFLKLSDNLGSAHVYDNFFPIRVERKAEDGIPLNLDYHNPMSSQFTYFDAIIGVPCLWAESPGFQIRLIFFLSLLELEFDFRPSFHHHVSRDSWPSTSFYPLHPIICIHFRHCLTHVDPFSSLLQIIILLFYSFLYIFILILYFADYFLQVTMNKNDIIIAIQTVNTIAYVVTIIIGIGGNFWVSWKVRNPSLTPHRYPTLLYFSEIS